MSMSFEETQVLLVYESTLWLLKINKTKEICLGLFVNDVKLLY